MSSTTPAPDSQPVVGVQTVPTAILEAMSALQTADALLRWRVRDRLKLRANEMLALEFLTRLERLGQPVRALDISRALGVTNGATTIIVARLMARGLISRTDNPLDKRGHLLHVTAASTSAFREARGTSGVDLTRLLSGLSARESKRVVVLLTAMTASLDLAGLTPDGLTPAA